MRRCGRFRSRPETVTIPNHMKGAAYHRKAYAHAIATAAAYRKAGWESCAKAQDEIAAEFAGYLDYAGEAADARRS